MALPALRALRSAHPEAHIAVLARRWVAALFAWDACADEVIPYPAGWYGRLRLAAALRRGEWDWAVILPNSWESALLPWLARIPRRTGYAVDGRGVLLSDAPPKPPRGSIPVHESFSYAELLRRCGAIAELPSASPVVLRRAEEAAERGRRCFAALGLEPPIVGLSPGAQNSRAKRWPADRFLETADRLAGELGAAVAIFGTAQERPLGLWLAAELRRRDRRVLNLAGETGLEEFLALAAACGLFVSNDSGAMHAASVLGVPTVAIFGPTEYFATAPLGPRWVIVREPVECSPCMRRDCPTDHRCMLRVTPERVARAALDLLEWEKNRGHANQDSGSGSGPGTAAAGETMQGGHRLL